MHVVAIAGVFPRRGILGTGFGVVLGFFLFPLVFPPPPAEQFSVLISPADLRRKS